MDCLVPFLLDPIKCLKLTNYAATFPIKCLTFTLPNSTMFSLVPDHPL